MPEITESGLLQQAPPAAPAPGHLAPASGDLAPASSNPAPAPSELGPEIQKVQSARQEQLDALVWRTQELADELASKPNLGLKEAPRRELARCAEIGLLTAAFPAAFGGMGLGSEPGTHLTLLRVLAAVGGADLALGRILEGHINGVLLVLRYGTREQAQELAAEVREGKLSGVWNTGSAVVLKLHPRGETYAFEGEKTFATGAAFVERPIVTAELVSTENTNRGWQMTMPRMHTLGASIDRSFWHPLGMESSESFGVNFSEGVVQANQLIGQPGDFYRDPMFRGGAIRFAAVQAGAILRLHTLFAEWLDEMRRGDDPYQIARLAEVAVAAQEVVLWTERAASVAEECFYRHEHEHVERMIECANMMRISVERQATRVMQLVTAGVGAHGLLQPRRFERILRDLTMYLRQPAPDQTLAAVGRLALEKTRKPTRGAQAGFWSGDNISRSLPPTYFQKIYARQSDPWDFEKSSYEQHKYDTTLRSLPQDSYENALEVGCSIGVLTERLSARADRLLGLDISSRALEAARQRCLHKTGVRFACMQVPAQMPEGPFDLIVVSEVAYYWQMKDLESAATRLAERHLPGGHLVLVHLTEYVPDYPLRGDEVHDYWLSRPEWRSVQHQRHTRFRLDVLERLTDN